MNGLCLHTGGATVSREQLGLVALPERTKSFVPIAHNVFLNRVQDSLIGSGLRVVEEAHGLSREGAEYFGLLRVQNGHEDTDFSLVVGLRNAHNKRFPAGIACGATVFVCDNLSFSGEVKLSRKHTANVERDLP